MRATRSGSPRRHAGSSRSFRPRPSCSLPSAPTPLVVGRTSYCDYPAAAKAVPDLGDGIKPNIEAVIASRPDLVVLYNSGQNAAVAGRLARARRRRRSGSTPMR